MLTIKLSHRLIESVMNDRFIPSTGRRRRLQYVAKRLRHILTDLCDFLW
ncbi:hypothetical protein [Exiguobacterium sp.]